MKLLIYIAASIGGVVGGYIPALWGGGGLLSGWSLLFGFIGTGVGCWVGYKLGQNFDI